MKKLILLLVANLILLSNVSFGQDGCIDQSLIDPFAICFTIYAPVCGCNGVTYSNSCVGQTQAGITSWTNGVCGANPCAPFVDNDNDGICSDKDCDDNNANVGSNLNDTDCDGVATSIDCDDNDPTVVATNINDADCDGVATAIDCDDNDPTVGICPPACIDSSLIDPTIFCPTVIDPVCGCDGNTYNNSCEAQAFFGVTSWTQGACISNCIPTNYVGGNINDGLYESTLLTHSDGNIASGKSVVFESETEVRLDANFDCDANVNFLAEIDDCNNYNLVIGMSNLYLPTVAQNFVKTNAGNFELFFDYGSTNLCLSSAVNVQVLVNGTMIYNQTKEVTNSANLVNTFFAPANANVTVNLSLVNSTLPANQLINCFVLGDAYFVLSE